MLQVGRLAYAKQGAHIRKALKRLKSYAGRVMRDLCRHLQDTPEGSPRDRIIAKLAFVAHLLHQAPKGADRICPVRAACRLPPLPGRRYNASVRGSKGKARMRCEFGCKVSVATKPDAGPVVGMRSLTGNPCHGHTLKEALEQIPVLTDRCPALTVGDRGCCGHGLEATRVLISGTRCRLTAECITDLRRRSAIAAETGHMKTDGRLTRCPL